ncbi:MAG TPA: hypothetical protein VNZ61_03215 [Roseomonas sp.]|nr:hypothetical protein [Roseomonas sp.]
MMHVAQGGQREAMLPRRPDAPVGDLPRHDLAIAHVAVERRHGTQAADLPCMAVGLQAPGAAVAKIGRQHARPMAVMATQRRLNEMVRNNGRLRTLTPEAVRVCISMSRSLSAVISIADSLFQPWSGDDGASPNPLLYRADEQTHGTSIDGRPRGARRPWSPGANG